MQTTGTRGAHARRHCTTALVGLIGLLGLAGCGGGTEDALSNALRKQQVAMDYPVTAPAWRACGQVFPDAFKDESAPVHDCATVRVPLDYAQPRGQTVEVALRRSPARDPQARIGTLFIEPGGPGGSGVASVPDFTQKLSAEVQRRFDIVGFDPRGVGLTRITGSAPGAPAMRCSADLSLYFSQDLGDASPAGSQRLEAEAAKAARACEHEPILPFMGTMNVARDLEVLRRAVGDAALSYIGVSYGTEVGIVYADMFPLHVRAMVIDGVVNPARSGAYILVKQAEGWQMGLENFFAWCQDVAHAKVCGSPALTKDDFQALQARAHSAPVTFPFEPQPRTLSTGWVTLLAALGAYEEASYPKLAKMLRDARAGNWGRLQTSAQGMAGADAIGPSVWTTCMDQPLPRGRDFDTQVLQPAVAIAPITGAVQANINRPCAHLPVTPDPVPTDYRATGSVPIMVWGTTGDPATPLESSREVVRQLDNASLFVFEANQHVAMGAATCVVDVQSDYLLTARLVPQQDICRRPLEAPSARSAQPGF